jgi:hypothetical protein
VDLVAAEAVEHLVLLHILLMVEEVWEEGLQQEVTAHHHLILIVKLKEPVPLDFIQTELFTSQQFLHRIWTVTGQDRMVREDQGALRQPLSMEQAGLFQLVTEVQVQLESGLPAQVNTT